MLRRHALNRRGCPDPASARRRETFLVELGRDLPERCCAFRFDPGDCRREVRGVLLGLGGSSRASLRRVLRSPDAPTGAAELHATALHFRECILSFPTLAGSSRDAAGIQRLGFPTTESRPGAPKDSATRSSNSPRWQTRQKCSSAAATVSPRSPLRSRLGFRTCATTKRCRGLRTLLASFSRRQDLQRERHRQVRGGQKVRVRRPQGPVRTCEQ